MKIQKYYHSCIGIEKDGKRLLIDPGSLALSEGKLSVEDIGAVDAILLTHKHLDHYDPVVLRALMQLANPVIITHQEVGAELRRASIPYEPIEALTGLQAAGFTIQAFQAPHGPIPAAVPYNLAYSIDGTVFHPGDSIEAYPDKRYPILLLPIAGPWLRLIDALAYAKKLQPRTVIPIHDGIIRNFMLQRMYDNMCHPQFEEAGIEFRPLAPHEFLET